MLLWHSSVSRQQTAAGGTDPMIGSPGTWGMGTSLDSAMLPDVLMFLEREEFSTRVK